MRIVIADDHALFRGGLKLHLSQIVEAAEMIEASSFDQVLAMVADQPEPGLVILDLAMPGPPWRESVARLRAAWNTARIVVLTADDSAETAQKVLSAGANAFILKTEQPDVFAAALRLVLSGGSYFPVSVLGREPVVSSPAPAAVAVPPPPRPNHAVTGRQKEVLALMALGCSNKEIAWRLDLTEGTVKLHVAAILRALGAQNRTQAVGLARTMGLIAGA